MAKTRAGTRAGAGADSKGALKRTLRILTACVLVAVAVTGIVGMKAVAVAPFAEVRAAEKVSRATVAAEEVPEWFRREVLSLDGARDIRCSGEGRVVGFSIEGPASAAYEALAAELEGRGWKTVPSGQEGLGTFLKEEGACTWLALSCSDVAGDAVAVVQCAAVEEGA